MRLPNAAHESGQWRIREIAPDFTLEDVWALPVHGGADDFPELLALVASLDPAGSNSLPARLLWRVRDLLGRSFRLDTVPTGHAAGTSLVRRLPEDLRGTAAGVDFGTVPFSPVYRTADEFAAELSNQTVHGVLHLAWVDQGGGVFRGRLAVYVKPRGAFGKGYMALIRPFRHRVVYPALMRQLERAWRARFA
jgi:hypothetical protein